MMSQVVWMVILTISVCAIILSAAIGDPATLMTMSCIVSFALALIAIHDHRQLEASSATRGKLSASIARNMGLIWMWGALGLLVSYGLILSETWPRWPLFFGIFAAASISFLLFAATLDRDEQLGRKDDGMINFGKYISMVQLAGMLVALVGIWLDPSKRLLSADMPDWVANDIFVAGAIALTAVSAYAVMNDKATQAGQVRGAH